jgi:hypothetical protein
MPRGKPAHGPGWLPDAELHQTESPYVEAVFIKCKVGIQRIGQVIRVSAPTGYRAEHSQTGAIVAKQCRTKDSAFLLVRTYHDLWIRKPGEVWKFRCTYCDARAPRGAPNYMLKCLSCGVLGCPKCQPDGICGDCAEGFAKTS